MTLVFCALAIITGRWTTEAKLLDTSMFWFLFTWLAITCAIISTFFES